jgi:hypothetical protein
MSVRIVIIQLINYWSWRTINLKWILDDIIIIIIIIECVDSIRFTRFSVLESLYFLMVVVAEILL